ncbi:hypothetical protein C6P40_004599 [Pichia californica]|uniref:Uncharacterized protein n=1 Tax=Pichia californica TaxID=460514 RepID=A0A9P6WM67_9ASCO|nr:hypothetical protein C6P40_004599 [[Candida] californica]
MNAFIRIGKSQKSSPYLKHFGYRTIPLCRREFHNSVHFMNIKKESATQTQSQKKIVDEEKIPYYEIPGTDMNPHNYFYRVLAVPYMKFCGVIILTYYSLNGLWEYLESQQTIENTE